MGALLTTPLADPSLVFFLSSPESRPPRTHNLVASERPALGKLSGHVLPPALVAFTELGCAKLGFHRAQISQGT